MADTVEPITEAEAVEMRRALLSDKDQTYVACTKTFARNWATEFHLAGQGL